MSQEEIFRKYMSNTTQARKKARNARRGNFQIVDNEVSMDSIPTGPTEDAEWGEEAPQMVAPKAENSKWRTMETTGGGFQEVDDGNGASASNKGRHDSDSDASPIRQEKLYSDNPDSDASPPRKRTFTEEPREASSSKKPKKKKKRRRKDSSGSDSDPSPERKGGLQTANELLEKLAKMKEFAEKKRREKEGDFKVPEAPVRRDAQGNKIDQMLEQAKESAENEEERKKLEKFVLYSKGLVQHKEAMAKRADNSYEMTKPVARYADDDDYNSLLKSKSRGEDDPMAKFTEKKKKKKSKKSKKKKKKSKKKKKYSGSESESSSSSSESEQEEYKGPAPPNRYGLLPGPKWDGVDRSNGYEKLLFMKKAEKVALKTEQYKYSTAYDM